MWELEVDRVVGLEDEAFVVILVWEIVGLELLRPIAGLELEGSVVGVDGDGALRYPCQSFSEAVVNSVKEDSAESKSILYCSIASKRLSNSVVPLRDAWMEVKPSSMESFSLCNKPTTLNSSRPWCTAIVNSVDRVLTFLSLLVSSITPTREFGEFVSPHIFCVLFMDVYSCSKCSFKIVVLGFPRDYLGVGTFEVGFELYVAGVDLEYLTDVGEHYAERHS